MATGEHPAPRRVAYTDYPNAAPQNAGYQPYPQLNYSPDTARYNTYQAGQVAARPGVPGWVWAALAGVIILVGVLVYLAIGSSGRDGAEPAPTTGEQTGGSQGANPGTGDPGGEDDGGDQAGSPQPDPSLLPTPPYSYNGYGEPWDNLETVAIGEELNLAGDDQEWDFAVTNVEWDADVSAIPDLDPAPEGYQYVRADIEATNVFGTDTGPWVNFVVSFGVSEDEIYDESVCWEGCLNRAEPDENDTYTGSLYYLVPEGTTEGHLLINPLFGGIPDVRVEAS